MSAKAIRVTPLQADFFSCTPHSQEIKIEKPNPLFVKLRDRMLRRFTHSGVSKGKQTHCLHRKYA